jgi:hypothetical protein
MGDSLRRRIDEGLARCRYGIVIFSPRFLAKDCHQMAGEELHLAAAIPNWQDHQNFP